MILIHSNSKSFLKNLFTFLSDILLISAFVLWVLALAEVLNAQEIKVGPIRVAKVGFVNQYELAAKEIESWFESQKEKDVECELPFLGLHLGDVTFKDVYEKHYENNFGALVTGIKEGTPAEQGGFLDGDIIVEFDEQKVKYKKHLENLIATKQIGNDASLTYFRDGKMNTVSLTITSRKLLEQSKISPDQTKAYKPKGLGGIGYMPVWFSHNNQAIDDVISSTGFSKLPGGFIHHGGGLSFLIGRGFFLGGMYAGRNTSKSTGYSFAADTDVTRYLKFTSKFGGITLDKRFRPSERLITSAGFMFGWGSKKLLVSQMEGSFDWEQIDTKLSESYYNLVELKKKYAVFQPKISVMYRVAAVFWLKLEAGYMLSYSGKDWQNVFAEKKYDISNTPKNSSLNGLTIMIGPWIGF